MPTWHQIQRQRRDLDRWARARELPEPGPEPARQPAPPAAEPELTAPRQPSPHEQYLERLRRKEADDAAKSRAFSNSKQTGEPE